MMEGIRLPIEARTLADEEGMTPAGGGFPPRDSDLDERRGQDPTDKVSPSTEVKGAVYQLMWLSGRLMLLVAEVGGTNPCKTPRLE